MAVVDRSEFIVNNVEFLRSLNQVKFALNDSEAHIWLIWCSYLIKWSRSSTIKEVCVNKIQKYLKWLNLIQIIEFKIHITVYELFALLHLLLARMASLWKEFTKLLGKFLIFRW